MQRDFAAHAQFQPVGTLPGPDRDVGRLLGDAPPVSPARVPGRPQSGVDLDATGEVTADTGARRRLPADVADPCGWRRRGFSPSAVSTETQELPVTLYHRLDDSLVYAA